MAADACLPIGGMLFLCQSSAQRQEEGQVSPGTATPAHELLSQLVTRWGFAPPTPDGGKEDIGKGVSPKVTAGCFRRISCKPRWRLSTIDEHDFAAFAILFKRVFGQDMSWDLWRWKYGDGRGCAMAAWRGEELVAHYGGSLRRVMAFNQPLLAWQICDAMVDPRERGVMTKRGAMFQVAAAFLELFHGLAGIPLAFGFPSRRAMRLGERIGHYAEVGALRELRWLPLDKRPRLGSRLRYLNPYSQADQNRVNRLWVAMQRDHGKGILGVRDWEQLRYRYLDHPVRHYELIMVSARISSIPLGLLVLQRETDAVALTDLVAPLSQIPALLIQARRLTGLWGKTSLYCWITRQHVDHFKTPGMEIRDIEVSIPTNVWVPQPFSPGELKDRWWLTIGDTDFL